MSNYYFLKVLKYEESTEPTMAAYDDYKTALKACHSEFAEAVGKDGLKSIKAVLLNDELSAIQYLDWAAEVTEASDDSILADI